MRAGDEDRGRACASERARLHSSGTDPSCHHLSNGLRPIPPPCPECKSEGSWKLVGIGCLLETAWGSLGCRSGAPFWASLGASCCLIGASWEPIGYSWVPFGCVLWPPGCLLGRKARIFGSRSPSWAPFGSLLGCIGTVMGASWAVLGSSYAVLGFSWGPRGPSWGGCGGLLGRLGASEARTNENPTNTSASLMVTGCSWMLLDGVLSHGPMRNPCLCSAQDACGGVWIGCSP